MILGSHIYVFTDRWSDDRLDILDRGHALGLEAIEIAVGDDVHFTPARTRARAEALHLTLSVSPGGLWPLAYDLSARDAGERAQGLAWHKRQVDVAAELGAVAYTGALYGHPGVVERRLPSLADYALIAEGLHALAEYAAELGVAIVLEPMSHFRTHLVNRPEQVMHLVSLADHENLRVLLDTYHLVTEIRDYGEAIRIVADRLWGIHACENDRGAPGGGLVPWSVVFAALAEVGFSGFVMLESYNSSIGDPPGRFAHERGMFHNVCPDADAFVRQSIAFIQQGVATATRERAADPS